METMKYQALQTAWLDYASVIIPDDAPPIQYTECKRAFFGGALSTLTILIQSGDGPEQHKEVMRHLKDELDNYIEEFKEKHNITD